MYIVASFKYSSYLNTLLVELENLGIPKSQILPVPLDRKDPTTQMDSLYFSERSSFIEIGGPLGTIFMLLGAIYGFILSWGPVIWGLIGLVAGIVGGFIINYLLKRKRGEQEVIKGDKAELSLLIHCTEENVREVEKLLWTHKPIGIGIVNLPNKKNG